MKKYKIFVACDTSNINFVRKIIQNTKNKKLEIIPKFGLQFFYSEKGRKFLEKFQDYEIEKISQKLENFGKTELDFINFNETKEPYVEKSLLSKVINFPKMLIYYK